MITKATYLGLIRWREDQDRARLTRLYDALDLYRAGTIGRDLVLRVVRRIERRAYERGWGRGQKARTDMTRL